MSTVQTQPAVAEQTARPGVPVELKVISRSALFYWWPVWTVGYVMALLTYVQGEAFSFADATVIIHPNKGIGVMYAAVFLLVLLITHSSVRGIASLTVIIAILAATFLFAYM